MRKAAGYLASIFSFALLLLATAGANSAWADPPGNNGTVKIHEGATEVEPLRANEPHVCTFHIHGFNFDANSRGTWRIEGWAPTGGGTFNGTWGAADAAGNWRAPQTGAMSIPPGHYKLFVAQTTPNDPPGGAKQKVFWVECGNAGTTTGGGASSAGSTSSSSSTTTAATTTGTGTSSNTTTNAGSSTTTTTTTGTSTTTTTGGGTSTTAGGNSNGNANSGGGANSSAAANSSGAANSTGGGVVAGVQSGPQLQAGAAGESGVPTALAGVENLPSTSTGDSSPALVAIGGLLTVSGILLLRRRASVIG
jgi:LPXTG-motif cell wall-anchored protein